jgi:hypothetical protein
MGCIVNGKKRGILFEGRYANAGGVMKGDRVKLTFPIVERTVKTKLGGKLYTLVIKGNEVVSIDPPGKYYPYYQRDHYRENKARWVKRDRFVANEVLDW